MHFLSPRRALTPALVVAALVAALVAGLVVPGVAAAVSTPSAAKPAPGSVAALRADVERTADRLEAATMSFERNQLTLGALVQQKMLSRRAAEQLDSDVVAARINVSNLAASLYRNPVNPMITAVLTGDANAIADMRAIRRAMGQSNTSQQSAVTLLSDRAQRAQELVAREDAAATKAIRLQRQLEGDLYKLQTDAAESLTRLQRTLAELKRKAAEEAARKSRAAAKAAALAGMASSGWQGGPSCSAGMPADPINGFLPDSALCGLKTAPGHRLDGSAAAAFDAMSAAYAETFGKGICVTDSYRDYAGQVAVFRSKPNLAAVPGRSQHGWGKALDLCGGVQSFGTPAYTWMKENSQAFGFIHPDWAEPGGSRPEPWHWEFVG